MPMVTTSMFRSVATLLTAAMLVGVAGCSLEDTSTPNPSGPSELGLSVSGFASPDRLPRDGASQSVVTLDVRDSQGRPVANQRLTLAVSPLTAVLSATEVTTDASGRARVTVTAPPSSVVGDTMSVSATPVGTGADIAIARIVTISLSGASNTTAPTAAFTFSPLAPVVQENVVFDATTSTDEGVACRDLCVYLWDFGGEATRTGRVVTYRFQSIRTYPVRLTVGDAAGASATLTTNVAVAQGTAPTASFNVSPTSPAQFETVRFNAEASRPGVSSRTIVSYDWKFGDGNTGTGVRTSNTYSALGTYVVTLTVTDSAGVQTTLTANVTVINGVTAAFTSSVLGFRIIVNAEESRGSDTGFGSRNPITRYIWHWGDSTSEEEVTDKITDHTYAAAATYTVTLTVVDSQGRRQTTSQSITIE